MKRSRALLIVSIAIALVPIGKYAWNVSHSTMMHSLERTLEPQDLVRESELVIVGTPIKSKTRIVNNDTAGSLVYTDWTVEVRQILKGTPPTPLIVTVPGGERFGQKTIADQFDGFKKKTEYMMYLTYIPEAKWWTPLSTTQAVFEKTGNSYADLGNRTQTIESAKNLIHQYATQ